MNGKNDAQTATGQILLTGIDGANLLAFLAALGALQMLAQAWPNREVRMKWAPSAGAFRPALEWHGDDGDPLDAISDRLNELGPETWFDRDALNFTDKEHEQLLHSARTMADPHLAARAAALGAMCMPDQRKREIQWRRQPLHCLSGQQGFFKACRTIVDKTTFGHVKTALLEPWSYADDGKGMSLRWDPIDDRRHALRWSDPSGAEQRMVRGAYRLAIEGLGMFPCLPGERRTRTVAFHGPARALGITWLIWGIPATAETAQSLLTHPGMALLTAEEKDRNKAKLVRSDLRARGLVAAYRSARIEPTDYANFTPGVQVL